MFKNNKIRSAGLLMLWPLVGCGEAGRGAETFVRDSAGVRIVETAGSIWVAGDEWTLSDAPATDIGVVDGEPEYQLFRAQSSVRIADGTIVVANGGTGELRWYDATGRYLRAAGGQGDGPGEFQTLSAVRRLGADSLIAYDGRALRISVFGADGVFARSTALEVPNAVLQGVFGDGSLLVTNSDLRSRMLAQLQSGSDDLDVGVTRVTERGFHVASTGEILDTLGQFPGPEGVIDIRPSGDAVAMSFAYRPFGRMVAFAVAPGAYYVGTQDRFAIDVFDPRGRLRTSVRHRADTIPVTAADIDRLTRQVLDDITDPNEVRRRRRQFEEAHYPETMPAHAAIRVDPDGNLWVQAFGYVNGEPSRWTVFDRAGQCLGTVTTPPRFLVHEIGRDYVLGAWWDDMDVQHIRLYTLRKPTT